MGDNGATQSLEDGSTLVQKRKCGNDFSIETCPMFNTKRSKINFADDYDVEGFPDDDDEEEVTEHDNGNIGFGPPLEPFIMPTEPPNSVADIHAIVFHEPIPVVINDLCFLERCGLCEKDFNSAAQGMQHYYGNNHRKALSKAMVFSGFKAPTPRFEQNLMEFSKTKKPMSQEVFFCDVCKIDVKTEKTYNMHLNGRGHAKKLRQLSLHPTGTPPTTQTPDNSLQELSAELESSYETSGQKQRFCLPCQASFMSVSDYTGHLASDLHRANCSTKALPGVPIPELSNPSIPVQFIHENPQFISEMHGNMNTIGQNSCTICGVTVTGQENLRMHLEGKVHRRKLALFASAQMPNAPPPSPFRCDLCEVVCSDHEQMSVHFSGKKHIKRALQLQHI